MKRIIALLLVCMMLFTSCKKHDADVKRLSLKMQALLKLQKPFQPEYTVETVSANVKPYEIELDFSNVNLIEKWHYNTPDRKEALLKDHFYIDYEKTDQPFSIYESNQYVYLNSFVTTDSVLHLYHVIYLGMMEQMEQTILKENLISMSYMMFESTLKDYEEHKEFSEYTAKNAALFYTVLRILSAERGLDVPKEILDISNAEIKNIESLSLAESAITGEEVDYSQFKVRGNYTKNQDLRDYFKANMLYSQNKYMLRDYEGNINKEAIKFAVVMARPLAINDDANFMWEKIYSPISFLVENSENVTPLELLKMVFEITGDESFELDEIMDDKVIEALAEKIANFETPEIAPQKGIFIAVLPQRTVVDNTWLQKMIDTAPRSKRPKASGLDVMALLGSDVAEELILNDEQNLLWGDFKKVYENTKELVQNRSDEEKRANIYRSWLWVLEGFNHKAEENLPSFMNNKKWELKELNSALASWAQLKHDTILYAEQFGAEMGAPEPVKNQHYVEPNVEVYRRLSWLTEYTLENSYRFDLLTDEQKARLNDFKGMVDFLEAVSIQELQNEAISEEDNERLELIGGEMENIFLAFYTPPEDEDTMFRVPPSERDMLNVADIQQIGSNSVGLPAGEFLEVGSGNFSRIIVIYRVNGKYHIGCGPVMNYYEFLSEDRMTNDEFKKRVGSFYETPENPILPYFMDTLYASPDRYY